MQEKAMVSDTLNALNSGLKGFEDMITQTENQELRQTLIKIRNDSETSQYELFTLAKNLSYYKPAQPASSQEIETVKSMVSHGQMK